MPGFFSKAFGAGVPGFFTLRGWRALVFSKVCRAGVSGFFRRFLGLACLVFFCLGFPGGFSGLACLGFSRKFSGLECLVFLEAFGTGLKGGERQRRFGFTAFRRWPRSSAMLALRGVSPGMPGGPDWPLS